MSVTKHKSKAIVLLPGVCRFVSYAVFHALAGSYIFTIYSLFHEPLHIWGPNPEAKARLAAAIVGTLIGSYVGALSWLSHRLFKQKLGFALRCTVAVAAPALMSAGLLTMVEHPSDWKALAIYFIPGAVLGLTTGLIAGARRNPWELLLRGFGQTQQHNTPFSIVTGLALRLGGLFGVLAFTFLLAAFSGTSGDTTLEDLVIFSSVFTYFGLTILIAFVSPPRWIALVTGLFINVPTVFLAVKTWDVAKSWAIPITYLLVWGLFIVGRPASVRRQTVKAATINKVEPAWVKGR